MQLQQECRQVQVQQQECRVCRQGINDTEVQATRIVVAMFGSLALEICPSCGQKADKSDRNYRRRATRWLALRVTWLFSTESICRTAANPFVWPKT